MWTLIKKICRKIKINQSESKGSLSLTHSFPVHFDIDDVEENNGDLKADIEVKKFTELEVLVDDLTSYSGYIREKKLREVQENFEPELFSHILDRLSDYVYINRELAQAHILKWSTKDIFSTLCINNFLLISILHVKERTNKQFIQIFFDAVKRDLTALERVLMTHQGELSKVLLAYATKYQWIDHERMLEICRSSNYQVVRNYWLDEIIATESDVVLLYHLKQCPYKDVQYRILDALYRKDILTIEEIIELWESKFYSIMDYAHFILRQKGFNFDLYLQNVSVENLTSSQARTRASQWLLVNGDVDVFFDILNQISSETTINSLLFKALKQKYISLDILLDFFEKNQRKIEFWYLLKLKKYTTTKFSLAQTEKYLNLIESPVPLISILQIVAGCNSWDEFYWVVIHYQFIETKEDKEYFDEYIRTKLKFLHYEKYPPQWLFEQKEKFRKLIPVFYEDYRDLLSHADIQVILQEYI